MRTASCTAASVHPRHGYIRDSSRGKLACQQRGLLPKPLHDGPSHLLAAERERAQVGHRLDDVDDDGSFWLGGVKGELRDATRDELHEGEELLWLA